MTIFIVAKRAADRWKPLFANEPWWSNYAHLHDSIGHDWEGFDLTLDQIAYALAKARGLSTTQKCPSCDQEVDQARTITSYGECDSCHEKTEAEHQLTLARRAQQAAEEAAARERMLAAMSPLQREQFLAQEKSSVITVMRGLFHRDVQ